MIMVRHADDLVLGFQREADARHFWEAMRERLLEFSLTLHPEKTRLIEFGGLAAAQREKRGLNKPDVFKFLGLQSSPPFKGSCGEYRPKISSCLVD
jgi:hypothetical protein